MGSLPNAPSQCNTANSLPCRHTKHFVKVMMHLTCKKEFQFLLSFESLRIEFFFALIEFAEPVKVVVISLEKCNKKPCRY